MFWDEPAEDLQQYLVLLACRGKWATLVDENAVFVDVESIKNVSTVFDVTLNCHNMSVWHAILDAIHLFNSI